MNLRALGGEPRVLAPFFVERGDATHVLQLFLPLVEVFARRDLILFWFLKSTNAASEVAECVGASLVLAHVDARFGARSRPCRLALLVVSPATRLGTPV
mmetsp:Transcript_20564/g.27777  ORF Transcript_20564/g.27777 Transcript_20564/m.27777 type:complete len:99 (-) Transcript_20564:529-825(-)